MNELDGACGLPLVKIIRSLTPGTAKEIMCIEIMMAHK